MTRAFVVGNGPSLNRTSLDLIKDEVSFGVNRVHLIYPRTAWRPTYWVLADRSNSTSYSQDINFHLHQDYACYVRADIPRGAEALMWAREYPNTFIPFPECDHIDSARNPATAWHMDMGYCKFGGSLAVAMQIAVKMRYTPLYLIGCDLGIQANRHNHFDPEYVDPDCIKPPADLVVNATLLAMHRIAREEAAKRGIEIFNATDGGVLEVYPRVEYERLFNGKAKITT